MENRAYALAAGLFTVLLGSGIVVAIMWLSGETYERESYWLLSKQPVTGLYVQGPVRYRGVEVGKVEHIAFQDNNPQEIVVRISVQAGTPLTRGTHAEIRPQGITGLAYVMLDDTGKATEPLTPGSSDYYIPVQPSLFETLMAAGPELVSDVRRVAARLNAMMSEDNERELVGALSNLKTAAARIASLAQAAEPGVKSIPALADDARKLMARADTLVGNVGELTLQVTRRLDTLDRMAGAVERAGTAAEKAGGAAVSVSNRVVDDSLPRINALADELAQTSRDLDRLIGQMRDQPQSLIFGRTPPRPGPGEPGFDAGQGSR